MRIMLVITIGFALTSAYLLVSEDKFVKMNSFFFPLYNGDMKQIRLQAVIDHFITRLIYVGFVYLLWYYVPDERAFLNVVLSLFILYAVDYALGYNNPYAYMINGQIVKLKPEGKFIPISYSLVMSFLLIILTCIRAIQWIRS